MPSPAITAYRRVQGSANQSGAAVSKMRDRYCSACHPQPGTARTSSQEIVVW